MTYLQMLEANADADAKAKSYSDIQNIFFNIETE